MTKILRSYVSNAKFPIPDKIPLLQRVQTIKILGVTFTSILSVTLHVQGVIAACAQTVYAVLRTACPALAWVVR